MKKVFLLSLLLFALLSINAQQVQQNLPTATLKTASRLFATKNDLTSVILIIPADSVVSILDSDSTYYHVVFEDNEGYIFKRQAVPDKETVIQRQDQSAIQSGNDAKPVQEQQQSRFSYLENKYGTSMANRLMSGKIWKGMNAEMVNDSWGTAQKINRVVDGNVIKEEWIFRNTWLYFENNILMHWGPTKK